MEAISRRLWLTWGAVACGATVCGCRAPGLGELPLSRTFSDPQFNTAPESNTADREQSLPAASSSDEPGGVNLTLGDQPAASSWTNNYDEALAQAAAGGKLILAFFTGSDFCQPCMRLHQEVVETPEFQAWAAERFVLLELDYPRRTPQPPALQEQNRQLLSNYGVRAFPTVLVLSAKGEAIVQSRSYRGGGSEVWIRGLETQLAQL